MVSSTTFIKCFTASIDVLNVARSFTGGCLASRYLKADSYLDRDICNGIA